jgi:hypothetical protein
MKKKTDRINPTRNLYEKTNIVFSKENKLRIHTTKMAINP